MAGSEGCSSSGVVESLKHRAVFSGPGAPDVR